MYCYYVEVVSLILLLRYHPNLVPVLFFVLISLHTIPLLKMFFYYSLFMFYFSKRISRAPEKLKLVITVITNYFF